MTNTQYSVRKQNPANAAVAESTTRLSQESERHAILNNAIAGTPVLAILYLLPAIAISYMLWGQTPASRLIPWLIFVSLNAALLVMLPEVRKHKLAKNKNHSEWWILITGISVVLSSAWGLGGILLLSDASAQTTQLYYFLVLVILLSTTGCCAGMPRCWLIPASILTILSIFTYPGVVTSWQLVTLFLVSFLTGAFLRYRLDITISKKALLQTQTNFFAREYEHSQEDVLQLKKNNRRLSVHVNRQKREIERSRYTFSALHDGLIITDTTCLIEYINPAAEKLTGWVASDVNGRPVNRILKLIDDEKRERIPDPVRQCIEERRAQNSSEHSQLVRSDGLEYAIEYMVTPVYLKNRQLSGCAISLRDVTERRNKTRHIEWQATHDTLTQLINRAEFERRLTRLVRQDAVEGHTHALCFLDLDKFKRVNDEAGHDAGDVLLKRISRLLKRFIRDTDTIARLGGDEFGLLLYRCSPEKAIEITDTLRQRVEAYKFSWQGKQFNIGVSIGILPITGQHRDIHQLVKEADKACYQAKKAGRNQVCLIPNDKVIKKSERLSNKQATRKNTPELLLHELKPLFANLHESACEVSATAGFDRKALQALRKEERLKLDQWVLKSTLDAMSIEHPGVKDRPLMTLFPSHYSLADDGYTKLIQEILDTKNIMAERLCFIIDSKTLYQSESHVQHLIHLLKPKGCQFTLSNIEISSRTLTFLRYLPFDYLRLQADMLANAAIDNYEYERLRSLCSTAHNMGIKIIVADVDTVDCLPLLQELGIDYAAGNGISSPTLLQPMTA